MSEKQFCFEPNEELTLRNVAKRNGGSVHCHVRRWTDWPKEELETEIRNRMRYFYGQTDGTMQFPSSAEGDLLKMVFVLLSPNRTVSGGTPSDESDCWRIL